MFYGKITSAGDTFNYFFKAFLEKTIPNEEDIFGKAEETISFLWDTFFVFCGFSRSRDYFVFFLFLKQIHVLLLKVAGIVLFTIGL